MCLNLSSSVDINSQIINKCTQEDLNGDGRNDQNRDLFQGEETPPRCTAQLLSCVLWALALHCSSACAGMCAGRQWVTGTALGNDKQRDKSPGAVWKSVCHLGYCLLLAQPACFCSMSAEEKAVQRQLMGCPCWEQVSGVWIGPREVILPIFLTEKNYWCDDQ